jgi:hypothetical protein
MTARHETDLAALRTESTAVRTELGTIRGEAKDFTTVIVQQMGSLSARMGSYQEDLTGLKSTVADISRRVGGAMERIDRQAEVLRALNETQVRRAVVLNELLNVIARMKETTEPAIAMAAGQF